ncbi:hypothetical protein [Escherichia phage AV101]|nr:hypothetical protein [Escherichia phage AV101]
MRCLVTSSWAVYVDSTLKILISSASGINGVRVYLGDLNDGK